VSAFVGSIVAAASLGGCTFNPGPAGGANTGGGGTSSGNGAPGGTALGSAGSLGTGRGGSSGNNSGGGDIGTDAGCGQSNHGAMKTPGDLLLIQDKSGSMANDFSDMACGGRNQPACTGPTKWPTMTAALNQVIMNTETSINWGLKFYANNNTCGVNPGASVAPGPMNAAAIARAIMNQTPGGNTPTRFAVESGAAYIATLTDANPKYILLATDGEPNCCTAAGGVTCPPPPAGGNVNATTDDAATIAAVAAAYNGGMGIPVFVVGIGNLASAVGTLNSMAMAGGRPQAADAMGRVYFPADDPAQLQTALETISGQVLSCNFALDSVPPDPSNIYVKDQNNNQIPKDATNGWSYGAGMMSIIIRGSYCDQIMAGTITSVATIYGCPGVPIIP